MAAKKKTESEILFEKYLTNRSFKSEYEPPNDYASKEGEADYLVTSEKGKFYCEVKELKNSAAEEEEKRVFKTIIGKLNELNYGFPIRFDYSDEFNCESDLKFVFQAIKENLETIKTMQIGDKFFIPQKDCRLRDLVAIKSEKTGEIFYSFPDKDGLFHITTYDADLRETFQKGGDSGSQRFQDISNFLEPLFKVERTYGDHNEVLKPIRAYTDDTVKRLRLKVGKARKNLNNHRENDSPKVVVLYDKREGTLGVFPDQLKMIAFGDLTLTLRLDDENKPVSISGQHYGNNGTIKQRDINTSISAIAVLATRPEMRLTIVHNPEAKFPLDEEIFSNSIDTQYKVDPDSKKVFMIENR